MVARIGNWPPPPPRFRIDIKSYKKRISDWLQSDNNAVQQESNGATSYFFGNSYIAARTLSGTHAHLEIKRTSRASVSNGSEVTITVNIDSTDAETRIREITKTLRRMRENFDGFGTGLQRLGAAMQEFGGTK